MPDFYDALETRDSALREGQQFDELKKQLHNARDHAPAYAAILADVDIASVNDRITLAAIPLTRKSDIAKRQSELPPLGGYAAAPMDSFYNVFASPGGIFEPGAARDDYWNFARGLYAAGIRAGDLIHNTFSYHFTPAGLMVDSAARALGCPVFPGGVGQTELQVQVMARLKPRAYCGTPSFLKIILDKAAEMKISVDTLSLGLVGGEALPGSLRTELSDSGVDVVQFYGTADLGMVAYESSAKEGMILEEKVIVEIVRPGTGEPVAEGEVGEIVVTTLSPEYPLIRFATGDLSAFMSGNSPCGRTNRRIKGWMGRADQTAKVRGMFVHPSQVASVVSRHDELLRARLVIGRVDNQDVMTLKCEIENHQESIEQLIEQSVREICKLRADIELCPAGALPNDGVVIEDARPLD
ncbi:MAG: AMP-binding protein [Gammaproteobacteria bacterium]|nr:AMP-binding protein [Gammaproteobacteria bacterium]